MTNNKASIGNTSVGWGTVGSAALVTNADGLRLLPAGRNTDLPWVNIQQIIITPNAATTLSVGDVTVKGIAVANYGRVTITGSGSNTQSRWRCQSVSPTDLAAPSLAHA